MATSNTEGESKEDMRLNETKAVLHELAPLLNHFLGSLPEEPLSVDRSVLARASNILDRYRTAIMTQPDKANEASQFDTWRKGVQEGMIPMDIIENILDFCALPDVMHVGQLSKNLRTYVFEYLSRSLNRFLGRWAKDPMAFREQMKVTNAVISGSAALSFISRDGSWQPKDLDIYVPRGCARTLIQYLEEEEGYELMADPEETEEESDYEINEAVKKINDVYKMTRKSPANNLDDSIDIIEAASSNPVVLILNFHTTIVMNWISPYRIMILYPKLTFSKRAVAHCGLGRLTEPELKYSRRGFSLYPAATELGGSCGEACPQLIRSSKDIGVMEVSLDNQTEGRQASDEEEQFWVTGRVTNWTSRPWWQPKECPNPECPRFTPSRFLPARKSVSKDQLEATNDQMNVDD